MSDCNSMARVVELLAFGVMAGTLSGYVFYGIGVDHGAYREASRARIAKAEHDAFMQRTGFCKWPRAFYASVNCAGLAPNHPNYSPIAD